MNRWGREWYEGIGSKSGRRNEFCTDRGRERDAVKCTLLIGHYLFIDLAYMVRMHISHRLTRTSLGELDCRTSLAKGSEDGA